MSTDVVMPQMGESIAEGTIVRWIKQVGDSVERDEPLFEISTDKVDAEIPSPVAGIVTAIKVDVGETVPVDSVVATIGTAAEAARGATAAAPSAERPAAVETASVDRGAAGAPDALPGSAASSPSASGAPAETGASDRRHKSSPLVRRIASEHRIDLAEVPGTGSGGRVTKRDIMAFIEGGGADRTAGAAAPAAASPAAPLAGATAPSAAAPGRVEVVPMSVMRRTIAEHMVASRRTSAHVHSVFDVDFTRVAALRRARKADYERAGARLTYLAFIAQAVIEAIRATPVLNASIDGEHVLYKKDINLGIAVTLEDGLIVPVIKNADERNLLGLSRAIADVADRARTKRLKPDEVQGGTFTITNPGTFGASFGMPIINQPQVAILGVGALEKRPVVVNDAIAIRLRAYLVLGYDHRLIDGAVADQFMARVKHHLENFDEAAV